MADVILFTPQRGWTLNGAPLPGGKAIFYETGTATPVTVYADAALSSVLSQPVLADSNGVFPVVYFNGASNVRGVIRDADDVEVSDIDPVATVALAASGASGITFDASVNVPEANVQDAIETVDTNWRANAASQQAELDALGTASLMDDSADTDLSNDPDAAARRDIVKAAIDATQSMLIGVGQTYQDVTASRSRGTSYQNTTGRPIGVAVGGDLNINTRMQTSTDNSTWVDAGAAGENGQSYGQGFMIVPDSQYYRVESGSGTVEWWSELRA